MVKVKIEYDEKSHAAALARGRKTIAAPTALVQAYYDGFSDAIILTMKNGLSLRLPRATISELRKTTAKQLEHIEISPLRDSISIEAADVDIYVPGLLNDLMGDMLRKELSRSGGKATTAAKAEAARANGRKGGRPHKHAA